MNEEAPPLSPLGKMIRDIAKSMAKIEQTRNAMASSGVRPALAGIAVINPHAPEGHYNIQFIAGHFALLTLEVAVDHAIIMQKRRAQEDTAELEKALETLKEQQAQYAMQVRQLCDALPDKETPAPSLTGAAPRASREMFLECMKRGWDSYELRLTQDSGHIDSAGLSRICRPVSANPGLLLDPGFLRAQLGGKIPGIDGDAAGRETRMGRVLAGLAKVGKGMTARVPEKV